MPRLVAVPLTVAGSVLLASDEGLGVEKAPVRTRLHLIDHIGLEINVERAGHMFARRGLREESAEATVVGRRRVIKQATVRLDENRQDSLEEVQRYEYAR